MRKRVLIVDDDTTLASTTAEYLQHCDLETHCVENPAKALDHLHHHIADLVILDVVLPEMDGFTLLKRLRKRSQVPVIVVTERNTTSDRVAGLEAGADDYLSKPFDPRELALRIKAIFRRLGHQDRAVVQVQGLAFDEKQRKAQLEGSDLVLTTAEFEILALFVKHPHEIFSRDQITEHLQKRGWNVYSRSIDIAICRLRQKLKDDPKNPRYLKTVWGRGYMFLAEALNP